MENEIMLNPIIIRNILNVIIPLRVFHLILLYVVYVGYKMMKKARVI